MQAKVRSCVRADEGGDYAGATPPFPRRPDVGDEAGADDARNGAGDELFSTPGASKDGIHTYIHT